MICTLSTYFQIVTYFIRVTYMGEYQSPSITTQQESSRYRYYKSQTRKHKYSSSFITSIKHVFSRRHPVNALLLPCRLCPAQPNMNCHQTKLTNWIIKSSEFSTKCKWNTFLGSWGCCRAFFDGALEDWAFAVLSPALAGSFLPCPKSCVPTGLSAFIAAKTEA